MAALGERAKSGGVLARSPAGPGPVLARPDSVAVGVLGLPCRRATAARDMTTAGWGWAGWTAFHHPSRVGRTEGGISLVRASARTEGATGSYVHGKLSIVHCIVRKKSFYALERESPQGTRAGARRSAERLSTSFTKHDIAKTATEETMREVWKSGGGDEEVRTRVSRKGGEKDGHDQGPAGHGVATQTRPARGGPRAVR